MNRMPSHIRMCVAMVSVMGCASVRLAAQPQTREIQVTVHVRDNQSTGLAGVPVGVGPADRMYGKTDASGNVTLAGAVDNAVTTIWVGLLPVSKEESVEGARADLIRFDEIVRAWSFTQYVRVQLTPEVEEYEATIVGQPASVMSGRLANAQGAPIGGLLCKRDGLEIAEAVRADGAFSIGGFNKSQGGELFALDLTSGRVVSRIITQSEATVGGPIGDVVVPATTGVEITMNVTGRESLAVKFTNRADSVSLIGTNGQLFTFPIRKTGEVRLARRGNALPTVPEGTYYIAPGHIGENRTALALLDAVRAGRLTELDSADVQKLVVAPNVGPITINAANQEAAIFTLGGEQ